MVLVFGTMLAFGLGLGCTSERDDPPLRVYAAASLTDVVGALIEGYEAETGTPVSVSFGASSALARQIRDGAPADVFLSASPEWVEYLDEADAVAGRPVVLARNRLVAVTSLASADRGLQATDAESLLKSLADDDGVGIADAGVPAGEYARAALSSLGLLDAYRPHLVGQTDVRAVLHAVAQGELRVGFVYATDAAAGEAAVLFAFDASNHPPIEYQAVALHGASDPEAARAFLAHVQSDAAQTLLDSAGFELP